MDGLNGGGAAGAGGGGVMVLGATNRPDDLDDAFQRRFQKRIYIPLPGAAEREALLRLCLREVPLDRAADLADIARRTEHYSGADLSVVAKHAALAPMRRLQAEAARAFPRPEQMMQRLQAIQAGEARALAQPVGQGDLREAVAANRPSANPESIGYFKKYAAEHGAT